MLFVRADAAERRPGACVHISCLGCTQTPPGRALNHPTGCHFPSCDWFSVNVSAANFCKCHQQNRAKLAKRCDWESFWPRSVLGRTATARGHPVMSGRFSRGRIQRPICRDRASPFSVCFLALSIDEDSPSTENHKPRDPHNAARPKIS